MLIFSNSRVVIMKFHYICISFLSQVTDMINGKGQNVYRLPPPTSCPMNTSGEPINLRIPQTEKPTVTKV